MVETKVLAPEETTPLVKIFAAKFRRALNVPAYRHQLSDLETTFALQDIDNSAQALTIQIDRGALCLSEGISDAAVITIKLDFDHPERAKVEGLWRHPVLAKRIGALLEFPKGNWTDSVKRFWDHHHDYPGMPAGMTLRCTNEQRTITLGDQPSDCLIEGRADILAQVFNGDEVLVAALVSGKLKAESHFQYIVVISDVTGQMLLGDLE